MKFFLSVSSGNIAIEYFHGCRHITLIAHSTQQKMFSEQADHTVQRSTLFHIINGILSIVTQ